MIRGAFSYGSSFDPHSRIYDPALAGGGLLDVGVYAISCAASFFGFDPIQILGAADIGNSGVDEQAAMILTYEDGQMAVLNSGVNVSMPGWMEIYGRMDIWRSRVFGMHRWCAFIEMERMRLRHFHFPIEMDLYMRWSTHRGVFERD